MGVNWLLESKHEGKEVVKFTRFNYGEEVHKYLGDKQLASKLISCSQLPGGWCAAIMERTMDQCWNPLYLHK